MALITQLSGILSLSGKIYGNFVPDDANTAQAFKGIMCVYHGMDLKSEPQYIVEEKVEDYDIEDQQADQYETTYTPQPPTCPVSHHP